MLQRLHKRWTTSDRGPAAAGPRPWRCLGVIGSIVSLGAASPRDLGDNGVPTAVRKHLLHPRNAGHHREYVVVNPPASRRNAFGARVSSPNDRTLSLLGRPCAPIPRAVPDLAIAMLSISLSVSRRWRQGQRRPGPRRPNR